MVIVYLCEAERQAGVIGPCWLEQLQALYLGQSTQLSPLSDHLAPGHYCQCGPVYVRFLVFELTWVFNVPS